MVGYLFIWVAFAIAVAALAHRKERNGALWLLYGLLLGPIAVIHVVFARVKSKNGKSGRQKCPNCDADIQVEARICRHCGHKLPEGWAATWRRTG
ncbi:MAG: zinc ribbon domain-containing protein [Pseudomonadota bacterium]